MQLITATQMKAIVDTWCGHPEWAPEGKFYCEDNGVWVGCDNSTNDCWVEEFKTEADVRKWLGDEFVSTYCSLNEMAKEYYVHQSREVIYDAICKLLTDYEHPEDNEDYDDIDWEVAFYEMLVKIQSNWETVITQQND